MNTPKNTLAALIINFLPGLVLGVIFGALLGAFMTPIAEAWSSRQPNPTPTTVRLANR